MKIPYDIVIPTAVQHPCKGVVVKLCVEKRLLLKPGAGPWKTWTLKSMNAEKQGINMGLKNMIKK